jgi:hypothetical protein
MVYGTPTSENSFHEKGNDHFNAFLAFPLMWLFNTELKNLVGILFRSFDDPKKYKKLINFIF